MLLKIKQKIKINKKWVQIKKEKDRNLECGKK